MGDEESGGREERKRERRNEVMAADGCPSMSTEFRYILL